MVGVGDIKTAIEWAGQLVTEPKGTAVLRHEPANWRSGEREMPPYTSPKPALIFQSYRSNEGPENAFHVEVWVEGRFSNMEWPPEISDVRFFLHNARTGDGTALECTIDGPDKGVARQYGDRWVMPFHMQGFMRTRDDAVVNFRSPLLLDTYGYVRLESPSIYPANRGTSFLIAETEIDGREVGVRDWEWFAEWHEGAHAHSYALSQTFSPVNPQG